MIKKTAITLTLLLSQPLQAALISIDYLSINDNLITLDTTTNLEWLDLTVTQGLSVDDVQASSYINNQGFQYALTGDITTLFQHAGITQFSQNAPISAGQITEVNSLISLLGETSSGKNGFRASEGLHSPFERTGTMAGEWALTSVLKIIDDTEYFAEPSELSEADPQDAHYSGLGSFLIRPSTVPLPTAFWLFISGITGLASLSRRRPSIKTA